MRESSSSTIALPVVSSQDVLTTILRAGAQRMLAQAIEAEVAEWIDGHAPLTDEKGHRQVVRNGYLPKRTITTGVGPVEVQQPRVLDRRSGEEAEAFSSKILPPYLRKTKSLEELIPWLYLKGVSTGDFSEALQALVGPQAEGLSASTVTRLKQVWEQEYDAWSRHSWEGKEYVYVWADGIHFNIRLEEDRQCILVLLGATVDGHKELIALADGYRESEQSWKTLLVGRETARFEVRSQTGHRRRRLGLLEGSCASVSHDEGATLLGSQDGQRLGQTAETLAADSQGATASDLDGREKGRCPTSLRHLLGNVSCQVSQGRRVLTEGS